MCLNSFFKASKGNNIISNSRAFHSVGAAYINDRSKNELPYLSDYKAHSTIRRTPNLRQFSPKKKKK